MSWAANKKTVLCVGINVIDFITITAKYPEEDTDRRCIKGYWQRGGNASNNCTVLKNLGANVEFFGVLSRSEAFRILIDDMRKRHIEFGNCIKTDQDPPFSSVILSQETGTRTIVHCNMNFPHVTAEDFQQQINLDNYGWVHFEARSPKETLLMIRAVQDYNNGRQDKILMSLDLEKTVEECIVLCDMVDYVILAKELAETQGWECPEDACRSLDDKLQIRSGINVKRPVILCPWGGFGVGCLDMKGDYVQVDAYKPPKIVDTLGAGDTFLAALIYAVYIRERPLIEAVKFANRTAGYKCGHYGYDRVADVMRQPI